MKEEPEGETLDAEKRKRSKPNGTCNRLSWCFQFTVSQCPLYNSYTSNDKRIDMFVFQLQYIMATIKKKWQNYKNFQFLDIFSTENSCKLYRIHTNLSGFMDLYWLSSSTLLLSCSAWLFLVGYETAREFECINIILSKKINDRGKTAQILVRNVESIRYTTLNDH